MLTNETEEHSLHPPHTTLNQLRLALHVAAGMALKVDSFLGGLIHGEERYEQTYFVVDSASNVLRHQDDRHRGYYAILKKEEIVTALFLRFKPNPSIDR